MQTETIQSFINRLSNYPCSKPTTNQYANKLQRHNLELMFRHLAHAKPPLMLLGESAGYRGAAITGIPFVSERQINHKVHPIFETLPFETRSDIAEQSANIVWQILSKQERLPILWNAYPFHAHKAHSLQSNRKPTKKEIANAAALLQEVFDIFRPTIVAAVGVVAYSAANRYLNVHGSDVKIIYVRHPAQGGKLEFIKGMEEIYSMIER